MIIRCSLQRPFTLSTPIRNTQTYSWLKDQQAPIFHAFSSDQTSQPLLPITHSQRVAGTFHSHRMTRQPSYLCRLALTLFLQYMYDVVCLTYARSLCLLRAVAGSIALVAFRFFAGHIGHYSNCCCCCGGAFFLNATRIGPVRLGGLSIYYLDSAESLDSGTASSMGFAGI